MKKMMFLTIGVISILGSAAFAGTKCITNYNPNNPTVELKVEDNGYYTIEYYGHSRNTYKAIYKNVSPEFTPADQQQLKKVVDQSTWSDMPENLILSYDGKPTHSQNVDIILYKIIGLIPGQVITLYEKNCTASMSTE